MHRAVINRCLSREGINIFDEVVKEIEYEFNKSVRSVEDMRERDNKKRKGDIWEVFCKDWLIGSGNYSRVWLLDEYNTEFPHAFVSKQDNGIDLIGLTLGGWHAIQCKYRGKGLRVDWKSLSTFIAMCERTRAQDGLPWTRFVVMTNCTGITNKLPRTPKDKSICLKTFQNTSWDHWLRMVGKDNAIRLGNGEGAIQSNPVPMFKPLTLNVITPTMKQPEVEELRLRRLAYYSSKGL